MAARPYRLNIDERPRADLESGLGASPRGFESRILRHTRERRTGRVADVVVAEVQYETAGQ
jgi:hypothetical protein